ncbi:uncharacterized protein TM35_000201870 [Trypanosoma theileri]|uniref:Uncharacterized protein n=1 Tax=Trypanosoma theileri TaxID=67003 RepID=A0A1X0NTB3_9TRYP|nr:uncharacterized protein TM35_000201870 [Trypanosoma theileri]ORC87778.1 hypothetical protein TM35_000201870 [Trypanosoma theileri]
MLRVTPIHRIGTISTALANLVLLTSNSFSVCDPFGVLFIGGVVFRLMSLPATIYGDRCVSRAACALPELQEAYQQYRAIVDHPRAIIWEKKVAAQKLKNDRDRIFRNYHTDNVRLVVPHGAALLWAWYTLCSPAQQIGDFLSVGSVGNTAAAVNTVTPLTFQVLGLSFDPTLVVAATITLFNVHEYLKRRTGFSDGLDEWIQQASRCSTIVWSGFVALVMFTQIFTGFVSFIPPHIAPVWLGISVVSGCKSVLVNHTAPMRALLSIEDYPPSHGSYGASSTAEAHEYRLAFTGVDAEERREMWQTQKKALDYECNVRLHRMLKQVGLFDRVEEAEYEAEKLKRKLSVARERRQQREAREKDGSQEEEEKERERESICDEGLVSTSHIRETDVVGPSAASVAATHFDDIQLQDNERRQKRRGVVQS